MQEKARFVHGAHAKRCLVVVCVRGIAPRLRHALAAGIQRFQPTGSIPSRVYIASISYMVLRFNAADTSLLLEFPCVLISA